MLALSVTELSKNFNGTTALGSVSFSLERGKRLVVIGPSGSGKTVLLKAILGVLLPDSGRVAVEGRSLDLLSERNNFLDRVGVLFQQSALFDSMTVRENIAFRSLQNLPANRKEVFDLVDDVLKKVGLDSSVGDLMPAALSGGMQKRVGLARAAFLGPDFLFLDEPTAGLDPIMATSVTQLIRSLSRGGQATSVIVCSDLTTINRLADQVLMLHQGRPVWLGSIAGFRGTDNPYVRQFISKSAKGPIGNLID